MMTDILSPHNIPKSATAPSTTTTTNSCSTFKPRPPSSPFSTINGHGRTVPNRKLFLSSPTQTTENNSNPFCSAENNQRASMISPQQTICCSKRSSPLNIPTDQFNFCNERKIRLNIDLNEINEQPLHSILSTTIEGRRTNNGVGEIITNSPISNSYFNSPSSPPHNYSPFYNTSNKVNNNTTTVTSSSYRRRTVEKDDLMKIVPYSPHIPSPIMSKGLFGGDGSDFSPRSNWISTKKKTLVKEKIHQSLPPQEEENELSIMSPRHIVETYSNTKKKFTEIKNNPLFETALLENKSKVAEFKSEKYKIAREFCDMNSTLDSCYKELGSFTSLETTQDPLKFAVDQAFEQSPIHDHDDALHKRRQLKRLMKYSQNQIIANEYASDMGLKSLLLICELREKEKKEFPNNSLRKQDVENEIEGKKKTASPRTPRTPGRNKSKLPPLKFSEQYKLSKQNRSIAVNGDVSPQPSFQTPNSIMLSSPFTDV